MRRHRSFVEPVAPGKSREHLLHVCWLQPEIAADHVGEGDIEYLCFTLQEIGSALKERDAGSLTALRQQKLLEERLQSIEDRIATLREVERKLRVKVKRPGDARRS